MLHAESTLRPTLGQDRGAEARGARATELLLLALAFGLLGLLALRQAGSLDLGFHLRAGERMLTGGGWPRTDPFTFTLTHRDYIDTSWGYQLLVAAVARLAGAAGLVLFHAGVVLATFVVVLRTARLAPCDSAVVAALLALGGLACELRFETRPELVSYLVLAVVLQLLQRRAEGRPTQWLPLQLGLVHLLWANLHALFVLGWVAVACFLAGLWIRDRRPDRTLAAALALSVVATLANPYGWRATLFPLTLATRLRESNVFAGTIGEFRSPLALGLSEQLPFFPRLPLFAFWLFVAIVAISLAWQVKRRRYETALLAVAFLPLAFAMIRNIPIPVIACLPAAAWALSAVPAQGRSGRRLRRVAVAGVVAGALLLGPRVATNAYYVATRRPERFGLGWNRLSLPLDVAAYLRTSGLQGRMLNHLNFGGYLMWALREPVFIDGRLEVVGEEFYVEYRRALESDAGLEAAAARWRIGWIVFPYKTAPRLLGRLSRNPAWRLVYVDAEAVVFARLALNAGARADPSVASAFAAPEDGIATGELPGLGGGPRRTGAPRWLSGFVARQEFPADSFGLGLFHYFRGDPARAAGRFAAAIRESRGAYYELYNNLGAALRRMGRDEQAAACFELVLREVPGQPTAARLLDSLQSAPGGKK